MNFVVLNQTLRNLKTERSYAILNIIGLSVGMACAILLALYLQYELSYDKHNDQYQKIVRVNHEIDSGTNVTLHAQVSHFLGPLLVREYPQIEKYVSFRRASQRASMLKYENESYFVDDVYIADNSVFEIFSHDIVHGDPSQALVRPNTIAISQSVSERLFGEENPVGRTISTGIVDYQVSLVFADQADNTHFKYDALIANQGVLAPSADALANRRGNLWNLNSYTYLLMRDVGVEPTEEVFTDFFDRMMEGTTREGYRARFYVEPIADIHLNSVTLQDLPRGNVYSLYAFAAVAILVLLIACFNYINLATARAVSRSKEISIRKILGADKRILVSQFLIESIAYSFLALLVAMSLVELLLFGSTEFNLFGREFDSGFWLNPAAFGGLFFLGLGVGTSAGIYPAFYLARMEVGTRRKNVGRQSGNKVRSGLVLTQFTISIAVISATILMFLQLKFIDDQPFGFEHKNKLVLRVQGADSIERIQALIQQLQGSPAIRNVSLVTGNPITGKYNAAFEALLDNGSVYNLEYDYIRVDENFIETLGLKLGAGRGFETGLEAELRQVIINHAAAEEIGWENSIGKTFTIGGGPPWTVIGEVEDFRHNDMHSRINPFVFYYDVPDFEGQPQALRAAAARELIVDVSPEAMAEALAFIQDAWLKFDSVYPLQYEFLDEIMEQLHVSDNQQMNLIAMFAVFCILISCMGLFGLTAFTTGQKTKEIGIRKILGAASYQIIAQLFSNILKLLLLASALASLIAYFAIAGWLEGFYYRDAINPLAFVIASMLSISIAFITLATQSWHTAAQNPVQALRYE